MNSLRSTACLDLLDQQHGTGPGGSLSHPFWAHLFPYVCLLNSEFCPCTSDWLERLIERLGTHSGLGAVAPTLLYDDGSVQHEGMTYKRISKLGDWLFCDHPRKGMRRSDATGLRPCVAITGACVLMARSVAQRVGGFSEAYINDFEDADLCLRLHEIGLTCGLILMSSSIISSASRTRVVSGLVTKPPPLQRLGP